MQYSGLTQADVLLSFEKLEKDLRNTINFSGINFAGEREKVSFAGLMGVPVSSGESLSLGRISYYFDINNKSLVREENAYASPLSDSKALVSLKDVGFTYYYFNPKAENYVWADSVDGIPKAIKIKVVFKSENDKDIEITRTVLIPVSE